MSTTQIIIVIALSALGAIVHGSIGIGLGLVAAPALVAIDPAFAPGPLLLVGQLVGIRHIVAEHPAIDRRALTRGLMGVPFGIVGAILVLEMMSRRTMSIMIGSLTAIAALMLLRGITLSRTPRGETAAGAACAFSALTAALPGPPLVCVYSDMTPGTLRPTASALILTVAATGFVSLLLSGNFGSHEVDLFLWLVPGVLFGLSISRFVRPRIDKPWFRPLILVIALCGGVGLVLRQVL